MPYQWVPTQKQMEFLNSPEDEVFYGGAAGPGKSEALLLFSVMRRLKIPKSKGLILRRTFPELEMSLIARSREILPGFGAKYQERHHRWTFPNGSTLMFSYLERDEDVYRFQSAEFEDICFDELTQFCVVPETEVLTEAGWKPIPEIRPGERVLSLSPDKQIEYGEVTHTWEFPFDGELVSVRGAGIQYDVTPNHRLVIDGQKNRRWRFCEAKDLPNFAYHPRKGNWHGQEMEWIYLPKPSGRGIGTNQNSADRLPVDDYLALLGWYLAEGSSYNISGSPTVNIRQTKPNSSLDALMDRLPWRVRKTPGEGYRIFSRQLYEHLKPLGDTYTKRVPRWIMGLSKRQLTICFNAFAAGDGQFVDSGAIVFGLANEGLVDDLQEIAIKIGRVATKAYQLVRGKYHVWRLYVYNERADRAEIRQKHRSRKPYKGKVYCLTVEPHHTFLARFNGRMFWSGNSEFQYLYLLSRLRTTKPGVRCLVRSASNPGGVGHHWVRGRFVTVAPWGQTYVDPETGSTRKFIPGTLDDNPHINRKDYEKMLDMLPEDQRRMLRYGDWDAFTGQAFAEFHRAIHVVKPFPIPPWWRRWIGNDPGYTDPFAWYWFAADQDGNVYVYREFTREPADPRLSYSEQAEQVVALSVVGSEADRPEFTEGGVPVTEKIDFVVTGMDAFNRHPETGKAIIDYYRDGGLPWGCLKPIHGPNSRRVRKATVHEYLKWIKDENTGRTTARLRIFDTCVKLIETLPNLVADKNDAEKVAGCGIDHWYDALSYGLGAWHINKSKEKTHQEPRHVRYKERLVKRQKQRFAYRAYLN